MQLRKRPRGLGCRAATLVLCHGSATDGGVCVSTQNAHATPGPCGRNTPCLQLAPTVILGSIDTYQTTSNPPHNLSLVGDNMKRQNLRR